MKPNYNMVELDSMIRAFNDNSRAGLYMTERQNEKAITGYAAKMNRQFETEAVNSIKSTITYKDIFGGNLPVYRRVKLSFDMKTFTFSTEWVESIIPAERLYANVPKPNVNFLAVGYSLMSLVNVPLANKGEVVPIEKVLSIKALKEELGKLVDVPVTSQIVRDTAHFLKVEHVKSGMQVNIFVKEESVRAAFRQALDIKDCTHVYEAPKTEVEAVKTQEVKKEEKKG